MEYGFRKSYETNQYVNDYEGHFKGQPELFLHIDTAALWSISLLPGLQSTTVLDLNTGTLLSGAHPQGKHTHYFLFTHETHPLGAITLLLQINMFWIRMARVLSCNDCLRFRCRIIHPTYLRAARQFCVYNSELQQMWVVVGCQICGVAVCMNNPTWKEVPLLCVSCYFCSSSLFLFFYFPTTVTVSQ